jgi:probable rRNA maturation factor
MRVLQAENCAGTTEVSVLLTDDEGISALNGEYRGVDGATDVLSFSQHEGEDEFAGEENLLGDVVISVETAKRQAKEQGRELDAEIDMLVAHGLLHLLGYDHAEPAEAERMFARQNELLGQG